MKNIVGIIVMLCLLFSSGVGDNSPTTDIAKYGRWNKTTKNILSEDFHNSLPEETLVAKYGKTYYYSFWQALLGYPQFTIKVVLEFPDQKSFDEETQKIAERFKSIGEEDGATYYSVLLSSEYISKYFDDEVLDGMCYNFEGIVVNEASYTITFLCARAWDGQFKDDVAVDFLNNWIEN